MSVRTLLAPPLLSSADGRRGDLFARAPVGVYVSTLDGILVACNAAFVRLAGFESAADAVGMDLGTLFENTAGRAAAIARARAEDRVEQHRGRLRRRDGTARIVVETLVRAAGEPGEDADTGAPAQLHGFVVDITATAEAEASRAEREQLERRALEERLAQSEKIESIGRLAGGIAHDFNNLLTAILGYTELLLAHHERADDPDRLDLQEIQKAGKRAATLTQQLLAFGRKQVLMPKEVDLNETVTGLQGMLARLIREDITLSFDCAREPACVRIDPTQIEQVVLNLVLNARDALPAGGRIHLEVAQVPRSEVDVPPGVPAAAAYVRLRVSDNGVGVSDEARPHMFEPFFTTKDLGKGTGLGLASVYGIVQQSHGFIGFTSARGKGTTFTMHFPAMSRPDALNLHPAVLPPPAPGHETILLVEDEDAVRIIVSAVLRRQGYRVLEAASPRSACEIFERHADTIDLLVTDVVMPEMNGPALAQRLVAGRPELRILFISGYSDMTTPIDTNNPNVGFLSKPFQASVLTGRVREMLSRPAQGRSA